jgi:hypothetical protein
MRTPAIKATLFAAVIMLGCGLATAQAPAEAWKVFSSRGGWSIEYPSGWRTTSCQACSDVRAAGIWVGFRQTARGLPNWGIVNVGPNNDAKPAATNLDDWFAEMLLDHSPSPGEASSFLSKKRWTINGLPAMTVRYSRLGGESYLEQTFIVTDSDTFSISFGGGYDSRTGKPGPLEKLASYPTYVRMLASFKVTDK